VRRRIVRGARSIEAGWVLLGGKIKALSSPNRTSAPSKDQKKRWTKLKKLEVVLLVASMAVNGGMENKRRF
jgi:hypothetical protein